MSAAMNTSVKQNTPYWNFQKISPNVLELHIKGKFGGPEINFSALKVAERNILQMRRELSEFGLGISEIHVKINSVGGYSAEGISIYEMLKSHRAKKLVFIEGKCASAATIVAMAGDKISMVENGNFFIHISQTICIGSARDFLSMGYAMEKFERETRRLYAKRAKSLTDKKIKQMMVRETNLTARQALKLGFVDEILPASPDTQDELPDYSPTQEILDCRCFHCAFLPWRAYSAELKSKIKIGD